jgi:hypothetical protein
MFGDFRLTALPAADKKPDPKSPSLSPGHRTIVNDDELDF